MVELALTKKAHDVVLMDLRTISSVADYFICCHGDSDVHVKAIAEAVNKGMKENGQRPWHQEGIDYFHWVLLDYVDIVVHVFQKEARVFYGLERLWGDADIETFEEDD
ncbi:ribosome silencing factor [bacterium]|nr:ribosome silencing factor [bacterium]